jgi:hypothetical protein
MDINLLLAQETIAVRQQEKKHGKQTGNNTNNPLSEKGASPVRDKTPKVSALPSARISNGAGYLRACLGNSLYFYFIVRQFKNISLG